MVVLILVLAIAFTLAMIIQVILPFVASRQDQLNFELLDEDLRQIEVLVNRKVALVQTLRDLEYDWATDKMSEPDYKRFKKSCERQAIAVMRRLDAIHGGRDWEDHIDRAIDERVALPTKDDPIQPTAQPQDVPKENALPSQVDALPNTSRPSEISR